MPLTNYHSVRLQDPGKYDGWSYTTGGYIYGKSVKLPADVSVVWGHPRGKPEKFWVAQALRFPEAKYSVAEVKSWLQANLKKWIKIEPAKPKTEGGQMKRIKSVVEVVRLLTTEQDVSTKSWSAVKKSQLPRECFLWVEDPKLKSKWHLPYREGAGGIDSTTGMYKEAGAININAVRQIMAVLGGARVPKGAKPFKAPAAVVAKAEALAKRLKIGKYAEQQWPGFLAKGLPAAEQFVSLRAELEKAVSYKFGKDAYVSDFSNKEVIVAYSKSDIHPVASYESGEYEKIGYKFDKGKIVFTDTSIKVNKVTDYKETVELDRSCVSELNTMENELELAYSKQLTRHSVVTSVRGLK